MKAVVDIHRRFITDAEPAPGFRDLLALLVQVAGCHCGFLGRVSGSDGVRLGFEALATVHSAEPHRLDATEQPSEAVDLAGVDWPQLCEELIQEGQAAFFLPADHGQSNSRAWWGLPCLGDKGKLVGIVGLSDQPEDGEEELSGLLKSLCDLCGVMIDAVRLEKQRIESARRAGEARYRSFADHTTDGLFIHDAAGRMVDVNRRACESLGYTREELIGADPLTFDPDVTPELLAERMQRLKRGEIISFESIHQRKDGSTFPVEILVSPFQQHGKTYALASVRDISERKRSETALHESEERFRALVEISSQIVWTVGADGQVDEPVPSWEAFTGQPFEESINEGWVNVIHPEDRERVLAHWHHCSATGEQFEMEYRLWHAQSQQWRWTEVCGVCLRNPDGEPRSWVGMHTDITEKRLAAEALQLSEARYRNFVDHATDGLFFHEEDGTIIDVNRQACASLGYERSELIGMTPFDFDVDLTPALAQDLTVRLSAGETLKLDSRQQRKDGTIFPVEVRIRPFWVDGQWYSISLVQDITERRRAERSLRLTQFSVDHAAVAVFWINRDSIIRYVNDLACESLKYSRQQLVGMSLLDITDHTPHSWEERFEQVKRQRSVNFEAHHRRSDGSVFPINVTVHYDEFDGEEFLFAFAQDITKRKEAELRFEQQSAELLHASRLSTVGEMVAALSHEVAQPLSAIGNFAAACETILTSGSDTGQNDVHEYLEAIIKQNRRCAAILQRLRDYSKQSSTCRTPCDLAHLLRESAELVSSDLNSRLVQVRFDLPQELPEILVDRIQLQQVVVNLLTNARDAVCDQTIERRVITISATSTPESVEFQVDDLGKGFGELGAERLFEPFYTTKKKGMGIGLSICQSIIHEHGGKIDACSNESGGASFRVRLPLPGRKKI